MTYICEGCQTVWDLEDLPAQKGGTLEHFGTPVPEPVEVPLECPECGYELEEYKPKPVPMQDYMSLVKKEIRALRWMNREHEIAWHYTTSRDMSLRRYVLKRCHASMEEVRVARLNVRYCVRKMEEEK